MTNKDKIFLEQRKAFQKGKVLLSTIDGIREIDIKDLLDQDIDGLLYDLNRNMAVVMALFDENMIMNELALIKCLRYLHACVMDKERGGCNHPEKKD